MLVKSCPGTRTPLETNPRQHIGDADPVDVPETAYYLRLLEEGSLVAAAIGKKKGGDQ